MCFSNLGARACGLLPLVALWGMDEDLRRQLAEAREIRALQGET